MATVSTRSTSCWRRGASPRLGVRISRRRRSFVRSRPIQPARSPCAWAQSTNWPGSSNSKAASTTRRRCTRPRWRPLSRHGRRSKTKTRNFLTSRTPRLSTTITFVCWYRRARKRKRSPPPIKAAPARSSQGLGVTVGSKSFQAASLHPGAIASRADATLLFYWLGEKQSWLWAITPKKTTVFPLPAKAEITRMVERYRQALLGPEDPLTSANPEGLALYRILVAPAKSVLPPNARVVILCDGALSELNFETLLTDATKPHYWIEDADIVSAPSLLMLAALEAFARHQPQTPPAGRRRFPGPRLSRTAQRLRRDGADSQAFSAPG